MRLSIIPLLLFTCSLSAVEIDLSKVELPKSVAEIQGDLDKALEKAYWDYLDDVNKAKERALSRMKREEKRADALVQLKLKVEIERIEAIAVTDVFGEIPVKDQQSIIETGKTYHIGVKSNESNGIIGTEMWLFDKNNVLIINGKDWDAKWSMENNKITVSFRGGITVVFPNITKSLESDVSTHNRIYTITK